MQDDFGNTYGKSDQTLKPYMLYGDRSIMENPVQMQKDYILRDLEYLQGLYPGHMKRIQEYVISVCDRLDYKNSPMYDEFPDRLMIDQVCDAICRQIEKDGVLQQFSLESEEEADTELEEQNRQQSYEEDYYEQNPYGEDSYKEDSFDEDHTVEDQELEPGWGPSPLLGQRQPWGPPGGPGRPPWGPGPGRPPWGPESGPRPPWGPPPGPRPPWGPPHHRPPHHRPPRNPGFWFGDIVKILLLNEMHRRRCRSGFCF